MCDYSFEGVLVFVALELVRRCRPLMMWLWPTTSRTVHPTFGSLVSVVMVALVDAAADADAVAAEVVVAAVAIPVRPFRPFSFSSNTEHVARWWPLVLEWSAISDRNRSPIAWRALRPEPGRGAVPSVRPLRVAVRLSNCICRSYRNGICSNVCGPSARLCRHGHGIVRSLAASATMLMPSLSHSYHRYHFSNPSFLNPT